MGRRGDSAELAAHYAELLEEQARSDLSVVEFAEEAGVSAATLYSWRRRLGNGQAQAKLLEVSLVEEEQGPRRGSALRLHIDDRFQVQVPADFDAETLERLLEVLGRC